MIQFSMNIILIDDTECQQYCMEELTCYMELLNNRDKALGKLASEDYVRKVSKMLVHRGPITYTMFKDMVTNPLVWEKYYQPECQTTAIKECLDSPERWPDGLFSSEAGYKRYTIFSYYSIPFSRNFQEKNLEELLAYIHRDARYIEQSFEGPGASWFRLLEWLKELSYSPWLSPSCDKNLITVSKWWHNFNPYPNTGFRYCIRTICRKALRTRANKDGDTPLPLPSIPCLYEPRNGLINLPLHCMPFDLEPTSPTPDLSDIEGNNHDATHLTRDIQPCETAPTNAQLLHTIELDIATLLSINQCSISEPLHINMKVADNPSQTQINCEPAESASPFRRQSRNPERSPPKIKDNVPHCQWPFSDQYDTVVTPLEGRLGLLKRKFEGEEPRPQMVPLPRRYRNNTDEDAEPASLGPVCKKQKIHATYVDCGTLGSHFDYETFSKVNSYVIFCNTHKSQIQRMICDWLEALGGFPISSLDYPIIERINKVLTWWDGINSTHMLCSGEHACPHCMFCVDEEEEHRSEDRLAAVKLLVSSPSSSIEPTTGFSLLPIESSHEISLPCDDNKGKDVTQVFPCLADVNDDIERPDTQSGSGYWAGSASAHHGTVEVLKSEGVTIQCVIGDNTGRRRGTPSSLESELIEIAPILGSFQSMEKAVNMIYASMMQDDQVIPTLKITSPDNLAIGMNGLHIQKREQSRAQRPALGKPRTERQLEKSPDTLLAVDCEVEQMASSMNEKFEGSASCEMGDQNYQLLLTDSDGKVRS